MEPEWCSGLLVHHRLTGLCGCGLVSADSCSSQPHAQHDERHRTCRQMHPLREQLSEIEACHKAEKRQWVISEKVLLGLCFSGPAPNPMWTSHSAHKPAHKAVSWPHPIPLNWSILLVFLAVIAQLTASPGFKSHWLWLGRHGHEAITLTGTLRDLLGRASQS